MVCHSVGQRTDTQLCLGALTQLQTQQAEGQQRKLALLSAEVTPEVVGLTRGLMTALGDWMSRAKD